MTFVAHRSSSFRMVSLSIIVVVAATFTVGTLIDLVIITLELDRVTSAMSSAADAVTEVLDNGEPFLSAITIVPRVLDGQNISARNLNTQICMTGEFSAPTAENIICRPTNEGDIIRITGEIEVEPLMLRLFGVTELNLLASGISNRRLFRWFEPASP